ncbi:MAG: glycosyltransferase [Phycisphaerales bacterium]|nr:glycosyltransferase [Phycisphaerales bacterium]
MQRPAKFAKYLTHLGWDVEVWSGHHIPGLPCDASLLADLPEKLTRLGLDVWNLDSAAGMSLPRRIACKILRLLSYPDERLEWVLRSVTRLYRRLRRLPVNVILATYSPPSNLLLAWCLSRLTRTPWIADFRDLWTDDCAYPPGHRIRRWMDARWETRFLRSADAVVAVSTGQAKILASHVPHQTEKFHTITNGVDFQDFSMLYAPGQSSACSPAVGTKCDRDLPPQHGAEQRRVFLEGAPKRRRLLLTHVGRLERQRLSESILEGFRQFAAVHVDEVQSLRLLLVGHVNRGLLTKLQETGVEVVTTGALEHAASIRYMVASDWLLLPAAQGQNSESLIPGKTYEYLASGRPIWVLGHPTAEVWHRVKKLGAGRLCEPSPPSVAAGLKGLVTEWQAGRTPSGCAREAVLCYGRDTLAVRLSQLMESVIAEHNRRRCSLRRVGVASGCKDAKAGASQSCVPESF